MLIINFKNIYWLNNVLKMVYFDVYENHSYDDTVIIVSKALRNCGVHYFEIDVEDTMNEMRSGICNVDYNNFDADYYMKAINTIESHSDIVSNALSYAPWII